MRNGKEGITNIDAQTSAKTMSPEVAHRGRFVTNEVKLAPLKLYLPEVDEP